MRPSSKELIEQLGIDYIDTRLKNLTYDHASHLVQLRYGDPNNEINDKMIVFRDCFSVSINNWLEGQQGNVSQRPAELDFFFHEIVIEDIVINGIQLYKCSMVIPMMDCQITCGCIVIQCEQ